MQSTTNEKVAMGDSYALAHRDSRVVNGVYRFPNDAARDAWIAFFPRTRTPVDAASPVVRDGPVFIGPIGASPYRTGDRIPVAGAHIPAVLPQPHLSYAIAFADDAAHDALFAFPTDHSRDAWVAREPLARAPIARMHAMARFGGPPLATPARRTRTSENLIHEDTIAALPFAACLRAIRAARHWSVSAFATRMGVSHARITMWETLAPHEDARESDHHRLVRTLALSLLQNPQVFDALPPPPDGEALYAFRTHYAMTASDAARWFHVSLATYLRWERTHVTASAIPLIRRAIVLLSRSPLNRATFLPFPSSTSSADERSPSPSRGRLPASPTVRATTQILAQLRTPVPEAPLLPHANADSLLPASPEERFPRDRRYVLPESTVEMDDAPDGESDASQSLAPDAAALYQLRRDSRRSVAEMAALLGLRLRAYRSFECGRRAIPDTLKELLAHHFVDVPSVLTPPVRSPSTAPAMSPREHAPPPTRAIIPSAPKRAAPPVFINIGERTSGEANPDAPIAQDGQLLTAWEAAKLLRRPTAELDMLVRQGKIFPVRLTGGLRAFRRADIIAQRDKDLL